MSDMSVGMRSSMESAQPGTFERELADVSSKLNELLPDVDFGELNQAMAKYIEENPGTSKADALEAVVKQYKPEISSSDVAALRTEWEQFAAAAANDPGKLLELMAPPPVTSETTAESVKDLMAQLMLLMIEVLGEDAADSLLQGFAERDAIMALAKEKAKEMRFMAGVQFACGLASAGMQIAGGLGTMGMASASMKANVTQRQATAMNTKAQGFGQMMGGAAKLFDSIGQLAAGLGQAKIAELDGESQVAQTRKETAQKMEDMARDVLRTLADIYTNQAQREFDNKSRIFNI